MFNLLNILESKWRSAEAIIKAADNEIDMS